jgi:hypothetical protein
MTAGQLRATSEPSTATTSTEYHFILGHHPQRGIKFCPKMENQKRESEENNPVVGCFSSKESLVSTVLRHLQKYVANVWKALERLIDTSK